MLLFSASALLFGLRDWIIRGGAFFSPASVPRAPGLLLHNQLQGWAHAGTLPLTMRWHLASLKAAAVWEWLPALFFLAGISCCAARLALAAPRAGRRLSIPFAARLARRGWGFAGALAIGLLTLAGVIACVAFQRVPHVQDSIAQLFQARILAAGRLWVPVPRGVDFVGMEFLVEDHGRWYSQYPPGHSALLALGLLAGAPWLVNPLLGAAAVFAVYGAARAAFGPRLAAMSVALFALSPFVWFMSAEFMNHASSLLWGALALWAAAAAGAGRRARRPAGYRPPPLSDRSDASDLSDPADLRPRGAAGQPPGLWLAAAAGVCVGLAATSRPLTAASFVAPLLVYWISLPGKLSTRGARIALFAAACGVAAAPVLWFNWKTTGRPTLFGYEVRWGASGIGLGHSQWGPPHTPARGLDQSWRNIDAFDRYLLEWPFPCVVALAGLWFLRRRLRRFDWLLIGWIGALVATHFFYFYQDLCFGPRFLYEAVPAAVMLLARALTGLGEALASWWRVSRGRAVRRIWGLALCSSAAGLLINLPPLWHWYADSFWGVDPGFTRKIEHDITAPAVVFITDANRAREVRLIAAGVSARVAHSATVWLDEAWIDRLTLRALDPDGAPSAVSARHLETELAAASIRDHPSPRRKRAPWLDYRGPISSFTQAFVGNGPDIAGQKVIFALDLGARNGEFLADYPGRQAWKYTWDAAESAFRLVRIDAWAEAPAPPGLATR